MVRLYLFAEGQTELTFADTLIKPHLADFGVYLQGPVLIAKCRKKGLVQRGGGRYYLPMKNDILRFLSQETGEDVFFTTMIDFYRIHRDFPGKDEINDQLTPGDKVRHLEESFARDIGSDRFIPYIQLHEYEAYLFSDVDCFEYFHEDCKSEIGNLKAIAEEFANPEHIDEGESTAPSKRILTQFPDYDKVVEGSEIAKRIGLKTIRERCPHFKSWLSNLEALGNRYNISCPL